MALRNKLGSVMLHAGAAWNVRSIHTLASLGQITVDNEPAGFDTPLEAGDEIRFQNLHCQVVETASGRLQVIPASPAAPRTVAERVRVHAGQHKCLTMFTRKVYHQALLRHRKLPWGRGLGDFRHFFHRADFFTEDCHNHAICSLSGQGLDLSQFDDIRVVRLIRDPRDLLVSGYFYHLRGKEPWSTMVDPVDDDWMGTNTVVPEALSKGESLQSYLESVSLEEGLRAEMTVRSRHFDSMNSWPDHDPRVRVFRYEDVLGHEPETLREIFRFLGMPWTAQRYAAKVADQFRLGRKEVVSGHIRNANSGQWRQYFTPALNELFVDRYESLLQRHGYPLD